MTLEDLKNNIKRGTGNYSVDLKGFKLPKTKKVVANIISESRRFGYDMARYDILKLVEQFEKENELNTADRQSRIELLRAAGQAFDAISHAIIGE